MVEQGKERVFRMMDKLKKIAELAPELLPIDLIEFSYENMFISQDTQWMFIGRLVDDLQQEYADQGDFKGNDSEITLKTYPKGVYVLITGLGIWQEIDDADTLLEAVCDAWLSLKGGA